jgi:hypothetical protein
VVRRRLEQADLERRVQGCLGYLSSLAALLDERELEGTWEAIGPILERYLASRGREFEDEVQSKRERFLAWRVDTDMIERARITRGWTQCDLARVANVDRGTLTDMGS